MANAPRFGTLNVSSFSVGDMLRAGLAIRKTVQKADSLEEAANCITNYLYDSCANAETGARSCVLVRFYKTHPFGGLQPETQEFARKLLGDRPAEDSMPCLTLLATNGEEPDWNMRRASRGHQAIPLPTADVVRQAPMIAQLIEQMGVSIDDVVRGDVGEQRPAPGRTYDVFHVEHALGSPYIPAQREFVQPYSVESVVGFGGVLRSGELYAVILFSRDHIPQASAMRFRAIALDIRSALFSLDQKATWVEETG